MCVYNTHRRGVFGEMLFGGGESKNLFVVFVGNFYPSYFKVNPSFLDLKMSDLFVLRH